MKYELEDVEAIRDEVPIIRAVSGEIDRDFGFKIGTRVVSIMTRGVDMPYGQMRKLDLDDGRYFNETDFARSPPRGDPRATTPRRKSFRAHPEQDSTSRLAGWISK